MAFLGFSFGSIRFPVFELDLAKLLVSDVEEEAAKRSAEEQKQRTAIVALESDLNLGSSLLLVPLLCIVSFCTCWWEQECVIWVYVGEIMANWRMGRDYEVFLGLG